MRPRSAPLRERLREERGMTLIELLVGITGALIVTGVAVAIIVTANNLQTRTTYRLEATNRGRVGMERITRSVRSQQCLDGPTGVSAAAMRWAGDTGMEFYASVAPERLGSQPLEIRRIEWVQSTDPEFKDGGPPTGNILETLWRSANNVTAPDTNATPTSRNFIATSVQQPVVGGVAQPIFKYYGYIPTTQTPSSTPLAFSSLSTLALNPNRRPSVSEAERRGIILVEINYDSRPKRNKVAKSATVPFYNQVAVRSPLCM